MNKAETVREQAMYHNGYQEGYREGFSQNHASFGLTLSSLCGFAVFCLIIAFLLPIIGYYTGLWYSYWGS